MSNPFYDEMDWAFRGHRIEVVSTNGTRFEGILNRINHGTDSVLLHDATQLEPTERHLGSAFIRNVTSFFTPSPSTPGPKTIHEAPIENIVNSPYLDADPDPPDTHLRQAYRNGFTGSWPVCRVTELDLDGGQTGVKADPDGPIPLTSDRVTTYEMINGHKRIEACRRVGLRSHPVEVILCTDEQAEELVRLAHRSHFASEKDSTSEVSGPTVTETTPPDLVDP